MDAGQTEWIFGLWQALYKTIVHLADLYDDDEVKAYVKYPELKDKLAYYASQKKE